MAYTRLNMVAGDVFKASDVRHIEDALELALSNANSGNAKIFPVTFTDNESKIKDSLGFIEIKKNFYELNDNYESHYYESESKNKSEHENKVITERR